MSFVKCISPTSKKGTTKIIPVFGINTHNVTGCNPLGSDVVKSDQVQNERFCNICPTFQIKEVLSKNSNWHQFLTALEVNVLLALSLWKKEESCFKKMIEFCSKFPRDTCFFFIQKINKIKTFPRTKNSKIKQIDYGYQFIIAVRNLKTQRDIKEV